MHVLQTPVRFYPDVGGVESHVRELSSRLVDRDHAVTVLCAETDDAPRRETVEGVSVVRLSSPCSIANTDLTPWLPVAAIRLARRVDIIHTHLPTPWSADISALAGAVTGTPVVVTYHNDIVGDGIFDRVAGAYNATALRVTLRLADRIIVTRAEYAAESNLLPRYGSAVRTVRNGVDVERFQPSTVAPSEQRSIGLDPGSETVFFLSVLDEYHGYKGLDVLLEAMAELAGRETDPPQLVVGGDGPRLEHYKSLARELGVAELVTFVGYLAAGDVPTAYNAADVFVLPSTSAKQEGFGLVALEALACETPVITTDIVGVAEEIADGGFGAVVSPNDPIGLADAISAVLRDQPDVHAGRQLCLEDYSWESSVDDLLGVYRSVLEAES